MTAELRPFFIFQEVDAIISKPIEQLSGEGTKRLKRLYNMAIETQLNLQPLINELDDIPRDISLPGTPGAEARVDDQNNIAWFSLPAVPPIMKGASYRIQAEERRRWVKWIIYAYANNNFTLTFKRAMVVINIYADTNYVWDPDNRSVHAIINGIKNAGIVKDDDWAHLAYMVKGHITKINPRTEIAVLDMDNIMALKVALSPDCPAEDCS